MTDEQIKAYILKNPHHIDAKITRGGWVHAKTTRPFPDGEKAPRWVLVGRKSEVITTMQREITCFSCQGSGITSKAAHNTSGRDIQCSRCKGTGRCPGVMIEWAKAGKKMVDDRLKNDRSAREEANRIGCSVVELSNAERGLIDPVDFCGRWGL